MGGQLVIVALLVGWIAILTPPLLRARAANRQQPDFSDFYQSLSQLGRHNNAHALSDDPQSRRRQALTRRRTAERRRRVFNSLAGTSGFALVAAMLGTSTSLWVIFGLCFALLVGYVAVLVFVARQARPLPTVGRVQYLGAPLVPDFALHRSVNS